MHVYLDNYAGGQVLSSGETAAGGDFYHAVAEEAWRDAHVLSSEKKRKSGVLTAEELGALVCGRTQTIGASPARLLKTIHATLWILGKKHLVKKQVQVIAGRWVHILQFRRAGMSFLEATWEFVGGKRFNHHLIQKVRRELWLCICAVPLLHTNLAAKVTGVTTASDASKSGGAIGIATELSQEGQDFLDAELHVGRSLSQIPVLVVSLFNGIGGSFRCYDILGVTPLGMVYFEINEAANRVCSRRWPHAVALGDVTLCDRAMVRSWFLTYVGMKEIHLWAGFPCTDLSSAKSDRQGLQGPQSRLF